ncbi:MAG TPA: ATP-binding protein [Thermodesulfovibrionia bacterium]|nr:ATP-binding protein [Thermodesulfovibrionia bacterium]
MPIRPRFKNSSFKNYQVFNDGQKENVKWMEKYTAGFHNTRSPNIILLGTVGTGKTHLAAAVANILGDSVKTEFVKGIELLSRIKASWNNHPEESEKEALEDYRTCDLLVIDDVSVQFGSETEKLLFYNVLDYRYEYLRPSIITSNGNVNTLKFCLGERVLDRIMENGKILLFDWPSFRKNRQVFLEEK